MMTTSEPAEPLGQPSPTLVPAANKGSVSVGVGFFVPSRRGVEVVMEPPESWETHLGAARPIALVSLAPPAESVRSSLVLTLDDVPESMGFGDWQKGADVLLAREMPGYHLIDLERVDVAGVPGARRLATYRSREGFSVTMEQWVALDDRVGLTLTATSATTEYSAELGRFLTAASTLGFTSSDERGPAS